MLFFYLKNPTIHTEQLKAQENNERDVLSFPFIRLVAAVFQGKRCQNIYTRKKDYLCTIELRAAKGQEV